MMIHVGVQPELAGTAAVGLSGLYGVELTRDGEPLALQGEGAVVVLLDDGVAVEGVVDVVRADDKGSSEEFGEGRRVPKYHDHLRY